MQRSRIKLCSLVMIGSLMLGGCAGSSVHYDPLEPVNRGIYEFNDMVDNAVMKPVAQVYKDVLPDPVRTGLGNFFSNLGDVLVVANDVLQFKLEQAIQDASRVFVNSTFGVLGLFDVATPWGMEKHHEDFGQTLGYWGVGDGPYLVLPLLGPSGLRDAAGLVVDAQIDPVWNVNDMATRNSLVATEKINDRALLLEVKKVMDEAALDPYIFVREAYLQRRRNLVYDGNPPREELEEEENGEDIPQEAPKAPETKPEPTEPKTNY